MTPAPLPASDARQLAEELALLIDGATNYAIYMLDPQGHVTIWNRGAERIKGWRQNEIIGRHAEVFYTPADVLAGKPDADLVRAAAEGRFEEESCRLRKDGSSFLASVTITALYDDAGSLRGFGKVVRDITEEKTAEAALSRREQHLLSILATVPDAMIVTDAQGRIVSFSAAAERSFGYAEPGVLGRNLATLLCGLQLGGADGSTATLVGAIRMVTGIRCDGTTFPAELAVGETVSAGQRILTAFVRDLTERDRAEARLRELQSELIHVSRVSAMGTMASTLAHELNQPLTAITNYLETARDMLAVPTVRDLADVREALSEAAGQSIRAGQIVRRLRAFVARGDVEQCSEPLNALVRDAAKLGLIGAAETGIAINMEFADDKEGVHADRVQIQQVLVNLIRNALQAMADSPRRILTISTAIAADDQMLVTIADSGDGIPPAIADRLFQAFASTKPDGMGLGLSICRTIIEAHHGRIWAAPALGGGAAFHFTLPRELADVG
ncbi:PAS domain-containing sensor histidine kinase [Sphingomonas sp. UYP23]